MSNQDLILNIAVNLGRLGRWASENNLSRIPQFIADSEAYLNQVDSQSLSSVFKPTFSRFLQDFTYLKNTPVDQQDWPDTAFTWATILTHRAKLA